MLAQFGKSRSRVSANSSDRQLSIRPARTAADESELTIARTFRVPLQVVVDLGRLSVFVDAKDAKYRGQSAILEVVRITAVKRRSVAPAAKTSRTSS